MGCGEILFESIIWSNLRWDVSFSHTLRATDGDVCAFYLGKHAEQLRPLRRSEKPHTRHSAAVAAATDVGLDCSSWWT